MCNDDGIDKIDQHRTQDAFSFTKQSPMVKDEKSPENEDDKCSKL